jgi:uncharacterized membrane protein YhaH (DUF805 family)
MNFADAIRTCFTKYVDFNGRAKRPEFWWWALFVFLASLVAQWIGYLPSLVVSLGTLLPSIAVGARRLHDIDKSGWWQLVGLIPFIGWIIMIWWCVQDSKEPNRFA